MQCPACGGSRLALVSRPDAGPTGQFVCFTCGRLLAEAEVRRVPRA